MKIFNSADLSADLVLAQHSAYYHDLALRVMRKSKYSTFRHRHRRLKSPLPWTWNQLTVVVADLSTDLVL